MRARRISACLGKTPWPFDRCTFAPRVVEWWQTRITLWRAGSWSSSPGGGTVWLALPAPPCIRSGDLRPLGREFYTELGQFGAGGAVGHSALQCVRHTI